MDISFCSTISERHREDLEHLLFFNERQRDVRAGLIEALERYGAPEVVADEGMVRVIMPRRSDAQCLFVVGEDPESEELLGVAVYLRDSADTITVLHVAVSDEVVMEDGADPLTAIRLIQRIRELARCIRGVSWVRLVYPEGGQFRLPVSRTSPGSRSHATTEAELPT